MEKKLINTLMDANGYNEFVCDLFPDWEFVKDEMLLPERKTGTGNGTVHIYLQQENMGPLTKCFSSYITRYKRGQKMGDEECPSVTHFCQVSNLISLASSTYQYYGCNDLSFSLVEYLKELLAYEQDGFFRFESIFKLSTDDRPYFKQFSKKLFTRIIRSLFISEKSAYKISLYRNSSNGETAAFWQIGHSIPSDYIISSELVNTYQDNDKPYVPFDPEYEAPTERSFEQSDASTNKAMFVKYMKGLGRKQSTIDNYITVLETILPRLIRENLDPALVSLFDTIDYSYLLDLENKLWKCGPIQEYNLSGHNQLSAGFHRYKDFAQSLLSDEELGKILFS